MQSKFVRVVINKHLDYDLYSTKNSNYIYVPILKNAHSFGVEYFKNIAGFELTTDLQNKTLIIFLRDPIKRWISAVTQWFYMNVPGEDQTLDYIIDPVMMKMIFSAVVLDAHSSKQSDLLDYINLENTVCFNVDDINFTENLNHFISTFMNLPLPSTQPKKVNVSSEKPFKNHIIKQIETELQNNKSRMDNLKLFYQADLRYYKSLVTFYKPKNKLLWQK